MAWEGVTIVTAQLVFVLLQQSSTDGAGSTHLAYINPGVPTHGGSVGLGLLTT